MFQTAAVSAQQAPKAAALRSAAAHQRAAPRAACRCVIKILLVSLKVFLRSFISRRRGFFYRACVLPLLAYLIDCVVGAFALFMDVLMDGSMHHILLGLFATAFVLDN